MWVANRWTSRREHERVTSGARCNSCTKAREAPSTPRGVSPLRCATTPGLPRRSRKSRWKTLMERAVTSVGLGTQHLDRYAHELSGGQLQRLSIGRALITRPDIVFLDEPTSSLDVSVRGEILNLLMGLRESKGLSMILVSHDLDVISYVADRILVIYLGQIVEEGTASDVVARPAHPYTRALLTASSLPDPEEPLELAVDVRDASVVPTGCRLAPRCPLAESRCSEPQHLATSDGRSVRCWRAESVR